MEAVGLEGIRKAEFFAGHELRLEVRAVGLAYWEIDSAPVDFIRREDGSKTLNKF